MTRWRWLMSQLLRKLWLRATCFALLGVFSAVVAIWAQNLIPWQVADWIGSDAVDSLLNIIASSMLAVTTFSLSVMNSAYSAATTNVTPRATRLLVEDRLAQNVLSTFIGSFLFSIVGIIVLRTGAYGPGGRAVLFLVTIAVVAVIVIMLLRWIEHLTRLGRVGETTQRVEQATHRALRDRLDDPWLGGVALTRERATVPGDAMTVLAGQIGYLQHIDMFALSDCADKAGCDIHLLHNPGAFLYPDSVLAWARWPQGDAQTRQDFRQGVRAAFTLGDTRLFDQDPRFGLAVLSEIGSRALSPATNDPGTAIDVIGRATRLLAEWGGADLRGAAAEPPHPRVHVPPLTDADLFEDAFMLMARDGAGLIEVQLRLQKSLAALARLGPDSFRAAARDQAALALARAESGLTQPQDLARLRAEIAASAGPA